LISLIGIKPKTGGLYIDHNSWRSKEI